MPFLVDTISAKKIKQDLIDRARIKKSFARTLKKEGLSSERLGSAGNATALGVRSGGYGTNDKTTSDADSDSEQGVDGDGDLLESGTDDDEEDDFEEDTELAAHRRRIKGKGKEEPRATERPLSGRATTNNRPLNGKSSTRKDHPRATGPSHPSNPPDDGPSLRDLKRQAYLGLPSSTDTRAVHPARTRRQATKPAQQPSAANADGGAKKTRSGPQTTAAAAAAGARGERRRDGRPNLNARIGVMLEQIKRGK